MRELTVRIRFRLPSLGNAKRGDGRFHMVRDQDGRVMFMRSWHAANMAMAAGVYGRHQDEVDKIFWDVAVDGVVQKNGWHRRFYKASGGKDRYALHEAFLAGQVVGINCVVPGRVGDDDFWQLMAVAGRYRGLSPWKPGEFGLYDVVSLRPRRVPEQSAVEEVQTGGAGPDTKDEARCCEHRAP